MFSSEGHAHISVKNPRSMASAVVDYNEISKMQVPKGLSKEDIGDILKPLKQDLLTKSRTDNVQGLFNQGHLKTRESKDEAYEEFFEVGTEIKVKWTKEEIGDSGWRPGWYTAQIQMADIENDIIKVEYQSEPGCIYTVDVTPMIAQGKLRLKKGLF